MPVSTQFQWWCQNEWNTKTRFWCVLYQNTKWYKNCLHKTTIASSVTGLIQGRSAAAYNNIVSLKLFSLFSLLLQKKN